MAYNLFAQQKQQNYPNSQTAQKVNPGQGNAGETPEQFAAGKQGGLASVEAQPQPTQQPIQQAVTPATKPQVTLPAINPNSPTAGMDALSSMYTSPQDEERMRKASVANQRIMAVADALRHIGNIYNTVNYAPAQQLNSPVLEEQARYEKGKALRDKANLTYLNYQQAKAAQDAKARQWEAEYALKKEQSDWYKKKTEQQIKSQQEKDDRLERLAAAKIAYQQGIIDDKEFNRRVKEYYMSHGYTPTGGALGGSRGRSGGGAGGSRPTQWQTRYDDFDYANQNGIPINEETTDILGNKTVKRRDPNVVHAEVEAHKRNNKGRSTGGKGRFSGFSIHKK